MSPVDPLSSVIGKLKRGDLVTLKYTDDEILDLLESLNFLFETVSFLMKDEAIKGTPNGVAKLSRIVKMTEGQMVKLYKAIDLMGVPEEHERN